ncbi:MAG TPA: glycosyltransferase family 4 protein [Saprospiraceae bacterium]|nr:glycosyltransferase family 4 protein [Saprospiraceae bacterium]HMP22619.1 glycosyltransferase family 4 protein [Saprospiraceae bacterium]
MSNRRIAFIHPGSAYLPEIEAYQAFLGQHGFLSEVFVQPRPEQLPDFAVEWHFMGMDRLPRVPGRLKIHEYISLSLPPFARWKNRLKRYLNPRPDLRIFHNHLIKKELRFKNKTPFRFRDAGIGAHFFGYQTAEKRYDFVYHGAMDKARRLDILLQIFSERFPAHTLLLVGEPGEALRRRFGHVTNVHFAGQVPYTQIPHWLQQARYGLNYIPPVYPYDRQPSLKLLEYCALGLPVVTTNYTWARQFAKARAGHFFVIKNDWSNFYPQHIDAFIYHTPTVNDLQWNIILAESEILQWLRQNI